jgi:hypothetical protein
MTDDYIKKQYDKLGIAHKNKWLCYNKTRGVYGV